MNENSNPKSNRPQAEQDRTAQDRPTAETVARIYKHLQLVSYPDMKPGELQAEISILRNKAAIYCHADTTPEKINALVDAHADEITEWLDAWGID